MKNLSTRQIQDEIIETILQVTPCEDGSLTMACASCLSVDLVNLFLDILEG